MAKWLSTLVALLSGTPPPPDISVGDAVLTEDKLVEALGTMSDELGVDIVKEAVAFVGEHRATLTAMAADDLTRMFNQMHKDKGKFDEENYMAYLKSLNSAALIARIEHNANLADAIIDRINDERDLAKALLVRLSLVARYALTKAISIASHGLL